MKADSPRNALSGLRSLKRCDCAAANAVGRIKRVRAVLDGTISVNPRPEARHAAPCANKPFGRRRMSISPSRKTSPEADSAEAIERMAKIEIHDVLPKPATAWAGVAMPRKTHAITRPR
jgi:hypothetical protein